MGYFRSRTLCAAARLGIADVLGDGEGTVDQLAAACRADPAALHRLLRSLASFGIVSESKLATFFLTPMGAPLRKNAPDSVTEILCRNRRTWVCIAVPIRAANMEIQSTCA